MKNKLTITIGTKIKELRKELKRTQEELARDISISTVHMSYIEQGTRIPSTKIVSKIYKKAGRPVPEEMTILISNAKKEQKEIKIDISHENIIYHLKKSGKYTENNLKSLIKQTPDNIVLIYGLFNFLLEKAQTEKAKKFILDSLVNIKNQEDKKYIEALYYKLEGNFQLAISLVKQSITDFEKTFNDSQNSKERKSELLFRLASIYLSYGKSLFVNQKMNEAIKQFKLALECHTNLRSLHMNIFSQMDYANIIGWLAIIEENNKKRWEEFIIEAKKTILINYYETIDNCKDAESDIFYSEHYVISLVSLLAKSYAELARLENDKQKIEELLEAGEILFALYSPLNIQKDDPNYYRFYFNFASFYSIKAEIFSKILKREFVCELNLCYKGLRHTIESNYSMFMHELNLTPVQFSFYRKKMSKQLNELVELYSNISNSSVKGD